MQSHPLLVEVVKGPGSSVTLTDDEKADLENIRLAYEEYFTEYLPDGIEERTSYSRFLRCRKELNLAFAEITDDGLADTLGWALDPIKPIWSVIPELDAWLPRGGVSMPLVSSQDAGRRVYLSLRVQNDSDARECTYEFENRSHQRACGFVAIFANTRTRILRVEMLPQPPWGSFQLQVREDLPAPKKLVWQFSYADNVIPCGATVRIRVRFIGDPPVAKHVIWLVEGDPSLTNSPVNSLVLQGAAPGPPPAYVYIPPTTGDARQFGLANYAHSLEEQFVDRATAIQASSTMQADDKAFADWFLHLDMQTIPDSPRVDPGMSKAYAGVGLLLNYRYLARAEIYYQNGPVAPGSDEFRIFREMLDSDWAPQCTKVADAVRVKIEREFGEFSNPQALARFAQAFERFAEGRLAVGQFFGVPNGLNYFCFVELGAAMLDLVHEVDFWSLATSALAKSAEHYVRSFFHCGAERKPCGYSLDDFEGTTPWPLSVRIEVDSAWSQLTPEETMARYTQLVYTALRHSFTGLPSSAAEALDVPGTGCPKSFVLEELRPELRKELQAGRVVEPEDDSEPVG